jgi:hypothetical protein
VVRARTLQQREEVIVIYRARFIVRADSGSLPLAQGRL